MIVCEPKSGVPNPQFQAQPCPRFKSQSQGPRVLAFWVREQFFIPNYQADDICYILPLILYFP